jgi:hypothetical protein
MTIPKTDDFLSFTGLQRAPSMLNRVLTGAGLIGLGAMMGAGVGLWFGSPRTRQSVSKALANGIDAVAAKVAPKAEVRS